MSVAGGTVVPVCPDFVGWELDAEHAGRPALSRDRLVPLAGRWSLACAEPSCAGDGRLTELWSPVDAVPADAGLACWLTPLPVGHADMSISPWYSFNLSP